MERRRGNFEQQTDRSGGHRQEDYRVPGIARADGGADVGEARRSRQAVHDGESINQKSARKGAQQQVFHGGLVGALVAAQETHHDVKANGHQLQTDEQSHQIRASCEEKHAALGEQH